MGEAKRKAAGLYPSLGPVIIPGDLRTDIAKSVQSIAFTFIREPGGGACLFRSIIGARLLRRLKFQPNLTLGGMVYRVGPDLRRDVVAFCGEHNAGQLVNGRFVAHYWLQPGNDFIDFSVAEWPGLHLADVMPCDLGAIQWTIEPPPFFWADKTLARFRVNPHLMSEKRGTPDATALTRHNSWPTMSGGRSIATRSIVTSTSVARSTP